MKVLRLVLIGAIALSFVVIAHPSQPAQAQSGQSVGCNYANSDAVDGYSTGLGMPDSTFYAGETLTVTAGAPASGSTTSIQLTVGGTTLTVPFPGTLSYTFPTTGSHNVQWYVLPTPGELSATWTISCGFTGVPATQPTSNSAGIPGCDLGMPISSTSAMGHFSFNTEAYYAPGNLINPTLTLPAGKTAWVLGQDASHAYYQIVWACSLLWVPVNALEPLNDGKWWHGQPLPTGVVE